MIASTNIDIKLCITNSQKSLNIKRNLENVEAAAESELRKSENWGTISLSSLFKVPEGVSLFSKIEQPGRFLEVKVSCRYLIVIHAYTIDLDSGQY